MKLKTLASMPPEKKRQAVASLVTASLGPPNGQLKDLEARLAVFEGKYGMTTSEMLSAFRAGHLDDSADIAQWLVFAKVRGG
jgi:hypothetical protein